jgi:hypothetical protein
MCEKAGKILYLGKIHAKIQNPQIDDVARHLSPPWIGRNSFLAILPRLKRIRPDEFE